MSEADTCHTCGKAQTELPNPLKRCAKCLTGKYCSRDCQKADFKKHKKSCAPPASGVPGSLTNPPNEEIAAAANKCSDLMVAMRNSPDYPAEHTAVPILKHLYEFCMNSHNQYWGRLLQPRLGVEIAARPMDDPEEYKNHIFGKMEDLQRDSEGAFDMERWPDFDTEVYTDGLGRNQMAAMVIIDQSKQMMFGQPPGQVYGWTSEIKDVAKRLVGEETFNKYQRGA